MMGDLQTWGSEALTNVVRIPYEAHCEGRQRADEDGHAKILPQPRFLDRASSTIWTSNITKPNSVNHKENAALGVLGTAHPVGAQALSKMKVMIVDTALSLRPPVTRQRRKLKTNTGP